MIDTLPIEEESQVDVPRGTITYRLATTQDELHILTAFSAMLRELEPLGHDVLPTEHNVDFFYDHVFLPALVKGQHGIVLAFVHDQCIGCTFFAPETTRIQTVPGTAVAYGAWVSPAYRKQGVAREMQEIAHRQLRRLGFLKLTSVVMAGNHAGLASAKRAGATVTGYYTTVNLQD